MAKHILVLRELYQITERRDDSVYSVKYICDVWVPADTPEPEDFQFAVKGTDFEGDTIGTLYGS